jgi:hypothetical protein
MTIKHILPLLLLGSFMAMGKGWWDLIPIGLQLIFSLVLFLVNLIVLTFVLYFAGLIVVGGKKARFLDAFLISFLGTVLSAAFFLFIPYGLIALVLGIFVWLLLIKSLYETGWLGAIAVGFLAIIIFIVISIILALLFGIFDIIVKLLLGILTP